MRAVLLFLTASIFAFEPAIAAPPPPDSIEYALADTKLRVTMEVTLRSCPAAGDPQLKPSLTLQPIAEASVLRHRVAGGSLSSFLQKRELSLSLYDNGTLKAINSSASDRTLTILGNVAKIALNIATISAGGPAKSPLWAKGKSRSPASMTLTRCKEDIALLLEERQGLQTMRQKYRDLLAGSTEPAKTEAAGKALNTIAGRIVDIDKALTVTLSKDISPGARDETIIADWNPLALKSWFTDGGADVVRRLSVPIVFKSRYPEQPLARVNALADPCGNRCVTLLMREPVAAVAIVVAPPAGALWSLENAPATNETPLWIGQWGETALYPLRAKFGQTRTFKAEFDPFGRKTSAAFNSEASGEAISAGLAALSDSALAMDKARAAGLAIETAELEALQKYNKLKRCERILEEGGFTCD